MSEQTDSDRALIRALKGKYNLPLLNEAGFEVRPGQIELIDLVLASDESLAVSAYTGAGKSIVAIVKALQCISQGGRVVVTTITQHLVPQYVSFFEKCTQLVAGDIVAMSGDELGGKVKRRAELYAEKPKVIVATREIIWNDIQRGTFEWDDIQLFVFDECHHATGKDTYTRLIPAVRDRASVTALALSATVGNDNVSIRRIMTLLGTERLLHLERSAEVIVEHTYVVDLDDELSWAARIVKGEALACLQTIETDLYPRQYSLFDHEQTAALADTGEIPSFAERQQLVNDIQALYEVNQEQGGMLLSQWAEMGVYCHFYELLVMLGRFAFVDDFASRYAEHRIAPRGALARVFKGRVKSLSSKRWFETRVVLNRKIWQVFVKLSAGTPYEALVRSRTWGHVWRSAFNETAPKVELQELVDQFFERAVKAMAEREGWESPKNRPLLEILHKHPQDLVDGRVIVFGWTRRHAQFLQAWLSHRLQRVGFRASAVVGNQRTADAKADVHNTLRKFRSGVLNVLVSTEKIREGTDVAKANVCVEYVIPDTNPRRRVQGRGRIGRDRDAKVAYLYHILVRQSAEPQRFLMGRVRVKRMNNALRRLASDIVNPSTKGGDENEGG